MFAQLNCVTYKINDIWTVQCHSNIWKLFQKYGSGKQNMLKIIKSNSGKMSNVYMIYESGQAQNYVVEPRMCPQSGALLTILLQYLWQIYGPNMTIKATVKGTGYGWKLSLCVPSPPVNILRSSINLSEYFSRPVVTLDFCTHACWTDLALYEIFGRDFVQISFSYRDKAACIHDALCVCFRLSSWSGTDR